MFRMGDEFLHTQAGNNNAFNQDNETSWLDWKRKETFSDIFLFFKMIIGFRKKHPSIFQHDFWREDVQWFGVGKDVDMSYASHTLAFYLDGKRKKDSDLYVMINAYWEPLHFQIQAGNAQEWKQIVDTSLQSPLDITDIQSAKTLESPDRIVADRSVVVFERINSF
jgi:glycogen operon protein